MPPPLRRVETRDKTQSIDDRGRTIDESRPGNERDRSTTEALVASTPIDRSIDRPSDRSITRDIALVVVVVRHPRCAR